MKSARVGDVIEYNEFDLEELGFDRQKFTVTKIRESTVNGIPLRFIVADGVSEELGNLGTYRFNENGEMLSAAIAGIFEARKETEATARNFEYSADLFVLGTIRINKPIG